jgi:hypothetical protein
VNARSRNTRMSLTRKYPGVTASQFAVGFDVSSPARWLAGDGGSRILEQVAEEPTRITDGLAEVRHLVAMGSSKGGVGKSTLTLHLAGALRAPRASDCDPGRGLQPHQVYRSLIRTRSPSPTAGSGEAEPRYPAKMLVQVSS